MTDQRILGYIRQSLTRDDDSLSLAFQERSVRDLASKHGGVLIEPLVVDSDERGWDPNRPGIRELIERAERERPDAVAVYAVSRFARDNWLAEGTWRRLKQVNPAMAFLSVTEPHAEDDMVRGLLGVISEAERKRMGAFLSSSFRERARRGLPHGKTPFGFAKNGEGRLVINDDTAAWVRQMVERIEAGWSLWRVAVWLNDNAVDGRLWEPNTVRNTVTTVAVAGGVKTADVLTWEAHAPIIDRDRHARLCDLLATRRPIRRGKVVASWIEGLLSCGCGAPMYLMADRYNYDPPRGRFKCAAEPSQQSFQNRTYPPCTSSPRSIMQHRAESETIAALVQDVGAVRDPDAVYAELVRLDRSAQRDADRHRIERHLDRARNERERLLVLYRRGTLDVDRWETGDAASASRIHALDSDLAGIPVAPDRAAIEQDAAALIAVGALISRIVADDPAEVRGVLMDLGATVHLHGRDVRVSWPPRFAALVG